MPRSAVSPALTGLLLVLFGSSHVAKAENAALDRLKGDLEFLASDRLEGRDVGTPGGAEAADFIRKRFQELGLRSGTSDGSYFQVFKVKLGAKVDPASHLTLTAPDGSSINLAIDKDFQPLVLGGDGQWDAPLAFAGYGIHDPDNAFDEFAGLDIEGKVVLLIRREPQQADPKSPFNGTELSKHAELETKLKNCWERKAAAVLLVSDPHTTTKDGKDSLLAADYGGSTNAVGVPVAHVTQELANKILAGTPVESAANFEKAVDAELKPRSQLIPGWKAQGQFTFAKVQAETPNVVGVLDGVGVDADETIIIGAHYDHIGMGGPNSREPGVRAIHNGADDNASGTVALLEVARRFASRAEKPKRRLVFIAFSGEERGLLGSSHYVRRDPLIPLEKTALMINFDMVGRLKEDRLIVYGTKTADGIEAHLTQLDEEFSALKISQVPLGVPASDHISFYRKNIPSLHFFTGTHADYHMPTDDAEKINYAGMQLVVDFTEKLVDRYLDASDPPVFTAVKEDDPHAGLKIPSGPNTPYLGTSPDYGDEVEGVLLNGVRGGSPAAEGGLKAGDVIVSFDGHDIKNVRQYTAVLYAKKPGDKVKIAVLRGEGAGKERIELDITLGSRSKSQGE